MSSRTISFRRRPKRDERGAILVLSTVGLVVAMIAAGLAVDLGSLAQEARQDQKVADLAALDGVRSLPADPTAAAVASAVRNGYECPDTDPSDGCGLTVQWSDSVTGLFTSLAATLPLATAVRVTATSPHANDFPFVGNGRSVSRKGTASLGNGTGCYYPDICEQTPGTTESSVSPIGTVRVGSTLVSVSTPQATILNRLLTNTVGGSYTLNGVGWQGIASGNVSFSRLRTELGFAAGSPDSVLDTNISYRNLLDAAVRALNTDGSPSSLAAATPLAAIAGQVAAGAGVQFTLRELFDIQGNVGSGNDVADATINVMDIVRSGLVLADADHFAEFDLIASSDELGLLESALPNFVSAKVKFGLIEAPQQQTGPPKASDGTYRTVASTSQVRLMVTVRLKVNVVGIGLLDVDVPYYFAAGSAQAKLDTLHCSAGAATPTKVDIRAVTQPVTVSIGSVTDPNLKNPAATPAPGVATLVDVDLGLTSVELRTTTVVSTTVGSANQLLSFDPPYTASAAPKNVPGTQITNVPTLGSSNLDATVTVLGALSLSLESNLTTAVVNAIVAAALPLVNNLYRPMAKALGLSIGGADVWAPPVQNCNPTSFNTGPTSSVGPATPFGYQIPSLVG